MQPLAERSVVVNDKEEKVDPLEGYKGPAHSEEEQLEAEVRALHGLNEAGIDVDMVRDVMKSDELLKAMVGDRPMGRLVTMVTVRMDECFKVWTLSADPTSKEALLAHREARAGRLLLDWIQDVTNTGEQSAKILNEAEDYDQET